MPLIHDEIQLTGIPHSSVTKVITIRSSARTPYHLSLLLNPLFTYFTRLRYPVIMYGAEAKDHAPEVEQVDVVKHDVSVAFTDTGVFFDYLKFGEQTCLLSQF